MPVSDNVEKRVAIPPIPQYARQKPAFPGFFPTKLIVKWPLAGKIQHFCQYTEKVFRQDENH
jgi:hypothetical protein